MIEFVNGYFLLLIPIIIFLFLKKKKQSAIKFSNIDVLKNQKSTKNYIYKIGKYVILIGSILLVIALARPREPLGNAPITEKGIAIGLLLDVSGSMESVDIKPSRLEVAKETMETFVGKRPSDEIALVVFGGNAYTRIPLTLDHDILLQSLSEIDVNAMNEGGTAIGMAESVGINRLKKSDAKEKVLILVTDGDNNAGAIAPLTASQLAEELGIKIYTIGVGTDKTILPVDYFGMTRYQEYEGGLNEELLTEIAHMTGGEYYRAKDTETLEDIFKQIDQLEKSEFEQHNFKEYNELAFNLIKLGLLLIVVGLFLDRYYFIQIS